MYANGCLKPVFVHQGTFAEDPTRKYLLREVAVDEFNPTEEISVDSARGLSFQVR